jgi:hypothetical protein
MNLLMVYNMLILYNQNGINLLLWNKNEFIISYKWGIIKA